MTLYQIVYVTGHVGIARSWSGTLAALRQQTGWLHLVDHVERVAP